jgi:hypothetical protein
VHLPNEQAHYGASAAVSQLTPDKSANPRCGILGKDLSGNSTGLELAQLVPIENAGRSAALQTHARKCSKLTRFEYRCCPVIRR